MVKTKGDFTSKWIEWQKKEKEERKRKWDKEENRGIKKSNNNNNNNNRFLRIKRNSKRRKRERGKTQQKTERVGSHGGKKLSFGLFDIEHVSFGISLPVS